MSVLFHHAVRCEFPVRPCPSLLCEVQINLMSLLSVLETSGATHQKRTVPGGPRNFCQTLAVIVMTGCSGKIQGGIVCASCSVFVVASNRPFKT